MIKLLLLGLFTFWMCDTNSEVVKRATCPPNESEVECVHCGPKRCEDLGHPIPCAGGTALCKPECICVDGFVRDADSKCIPKSECESCGGDKNATSGCGNPCGNSCSDYKVNNKICFSGCRYNSCDCKPGYVYHDSLKICVLPADCC